MVVVSGSWVKNVATYPTPANNNDMVIPTTNKMSAKAILTCRPNSHPFQERILTLDQPVKVGRSVARARATATNAIFDCKVLSRHHAVLWYDSGKFYLQDTKSSNGTFVNNNRLSSSESEPHEVCSGDLVQFGVDVVENNHKVTHCCIVATLKLYLADGKEAKASPSITENSRHGLIPLDELYKLNQIIQEACQREQCLENKLNALQQIVDETRRSSDESWQAYIGEERLLSRVATLENQLLQVNKNISDDRLREELNKLQEERTVYQIAAKDTLHKLHAERLEAVVTASEQERAKLTAEQEFKLAKDQLTHVQQELQELAHKLMLEQQKLEEERVQVRQRERELQTKLETESQTVTDLQSKLEQYKLLVPNPMKELLPIEELEKCSLIYTDDMKSKEQMLSEMENCEMDYSNANNTEQNHINLRVAPVCNDGEETDTGTDVASDTELVADGSIDTTSTTLMGDFDRSLTDFSENEKEFAANSELAKNDYDDLQDPSDDEEKDADCKEGKIDSKTLKYHFQSLENKLKNQLECLQQEAIVNKNKIVMLESTLAQEKEINIDKGEECMLLKQELSIYQQKWKESYNQLQKRQDVNPLVNSDISNDESTYEKIKSLEEELVTLKEKFASINDERLSLSRSLVTIQSQYRNVCNRSYNMMFCYMAPLVFMVLYLIFSQYFS
ncbi:hypothetical protein PPYR_13525 [Photinus pyralis]|uniref:Sarcolemmal membrane-associated protein n=1 Tax=Photinus pyralis TaxID=7054 RepID=A0A1Y1MMM6_PHOPY|nr:sarcolemmal membrane-associated protein [Photinus pyralis]KAB0793905.1 hypothetical protein PPYR_13525 [Photinus pyralis]